MINAALYKRELKGSLKLLLIFGAVLTMYISMIISMYDPEVMKTLDSFAKAMPQLMAAVGMNADSGSLLGFMITYLYGFLLLVFPMVFSILRGNALIARYAEQGSLVSLMAAPVKRRTIARTQLAVLVSGIVLLVAYCTILELACAWYGFAGEFEVSQLLLLNGGLLCLQLFLGGICFLASCLCADTRSSIALGAGIPALMYVLQMLANVGGSAKWLKYVTCFTLFDAEGIVAGQGSAAAGAAVLLAGAVVLYGLGVLVFERKDLHI